MSSLSNMSVRSSGVAVRSTICDTTPSLLQRTAQCMKVSKIDAMVMSATPIINHVVYGALQPDPGASRNRDTTPDTGAFARAQLRARSQSPRNGRIRSRSPEYVSPNLRHLSLDAHGRGSMADKLQAPRHVYVQGMRVPCYEMHHIKALPTAALRAHAEHVHRCIGPSVIGNSVPAYDHLLTDWLLDVYRLHIHPRLRDESARVSTHLVPHAVPQIYVNGVPIPLFETHHLWKLPTATLRAHADHVYNSLGPSMMGGTVPASDDRVIAWLIEAHKNHLHPLKAQAVPHAVPYVYHEGVPLPLYEQHHLRSLFPSHLRAHANHVYNTIRGISSPVPQHDDWLLDWLIEVHNVHLNHHLARLRSRTSRTPSLRSKTSRTPSYCPSPQAGTPPHSRGSTPRSAGGGSRSPTKNGSSLLSNQYLIEAAASQLQDVQPICPQDLYGAVMDTLMAYGLTGSAEMLKRESKLGDVLDDRELRSGRPGLPDHVATAFNESQDVNDQQKLSVQLCTNRIAEQHVRLEQLIERVSRYRDESGVRTVEEERATRRLNDQNETLYKLRVSSEELHILARQMKRELEDNLQEKYRLTEATEITSLKMVQVKSKIQSIEKQLEVMSKKVEETDTAQAQRIRRLLLQWDTPEGPKRIAAETFAHVDTDHNMRLQWENDEICKFVRLMFYYHHVTSPPWPEVVWYELYRICAFDVPDSVDVVEALRFARGAFEAALRTLDDS